MRYSYLQIMKIVQLPPDPIASGNTFPPGPVVTPPITTWLRHCSQPSCSWVFGVQF